jgi:hypothetical protein
MAGGFLGYFTFGLSGQSRAAAYSIYSVIMAVGP